MMILLEIFSQRVYMLRVYSSSSACRLQPLGTSILVMTPKLLIILPVLTAVKTRAWYQGTWYVLLQCQLHNAWRDMHV